MPEPKAFIFDLDGTLLDTLADIAGCMNTVLDMHGLPQQKIQSYFYHVGEGMEKLVQNVLPPSMRTDEAMAAQLLAGMKKEYGARWNQLTRPYPGTAETLSALNESGIPICVLSNKPEEFTRKMVKYYFPEITFADIRGARQDVPKKPFPDAALQQAELLGVHPQDVAFIGDSSIDMLTACAAGMQPIGVAWGFRSRDELLRNGATLIIEDIREVCCLTVACEE